MLMASLHPAPPPISASILALPDTPTAPSQKAACRSRSFPLIPSPADPIGGIGRGIAPKNGGIDLLTDIQAKNAKAAGKSFKLSDSGGLFLFVTASGFKSWRWKYRFGGKEKQLVLGRYPETSIREARRLRDVADAMRRGGNDPAHQREQAKAQAAAERLETFEALATEWHRKQSALWRPKHSDKVFSSLKSNAFPLLGNLPVGTIKAPTVLAVLRKVEQRGSHDQAHRLRQRLEAIFAMAIGMGLAETNPATMVGKALAPVILRHYPALRSIQDARALIAASEDGPGNVVTKLASRMLAVTAARSEAVRYAEWGEIEGAQWRVPGAHMKGQREQRNDPNFEFIIPLPPQAVEIIDAVKALNGNYKLIFGGVRNPNKPMSDSTISTLYRRLPDFAGRHVPHGWRSTFSTVMNEWADTHGKPGDRAILDLMLAHKPQGVEGIYNRAAYMPRRRELAAIWADLLLDGLPLASSLMSPA